MKKICLFLLSACTYVLSPCQTQSFVYSDQKGTIQLTNDSSVIIFPKYKKDTKGNAFRTVAMGSDTFTISVMDTNNGKFQFVKSPQDKTIATVFLGSKKRNDIVLQDGTEYQWKVLGQTWYYTRNGIEVIKGVARKEEGQNKITITHLNSQSVPPIIRLVALERGTTRINSKAPGVFIAILLAATTAIQFLADDN